MEHYQGCGKFVSEVILGFLFPFHIPNQTNFSFAYNCFFVFETTDQLFCMPQLGLELRIQ